LVFPPAYMLTGVLCDRFAQLVEGGSFLMNGIGGVVLLLGIIPASLLAFCNFTAASILLRRDSSAAGLAIDPWASRKGPSGYALRRKVALWALLSAPSMLVIMVVAGCVLMLLADSR